MISSSCTLTGGCPALARFLLSSLGMTAKDQRRPAIPLERMPVEAMLACVEPFTAARNPELEVLARSVTRVRKPAGTALLREGHPSDGLYVVLRGRVNLVRQADGGRDIILSSLGPGEAFGESCAVEGMTSSTTALTALPTDIARVPAEVLTAHLLREPATMARLMKLMGDKLRDVESVASGLALCDVEERLRRTLAQLARRQGRPTASQDGAEGWIIAPMPTQSELARMVGSCRETVSRTLSAMARNGLLSSSGRRMILTDQIVQTELA